MTKCANWSIYETLVPEYKWKHESTEQSDTIGNIQMDWICSCMFVCVLRAMYLLQVQVVASVLDYKRGKKKLPRMLRMDTIITFELKLSLCMKTAPVDCRRIVSPIT